MDGSTAVLLPITPPQFSSGCAANPINTVSSLLLSRVNKHFDKLKEEENTVKQLTLQVFTGLMLHSKITKVQDSSQVAKAKNLSTWLQKAKEAYKKIEERQDLFSSHNQATLQRNSLILEQDYRDIEALFENVGLETNMTPADERILTELDKKIHSAIEVQIVKIEHGKLVERKELLDSINELTANINDAQAQIEKIDIDQIYQGHAKPLKEYQRSCIKNMQTMGLFLFIHVFHKISTEAEVSLVETQNKEKNAIQKIKDSFFEALSALYKKYNAFFEVLYKKNQEWIQSQRSIENDHAGKRRNSHSSQSSASSEALNVTEPNRKSASGNVSAQTDPFLYSIASDFKELHKSAASNFDINMFNIHDSIYGMDASMGISVPAHKLSFLERFLKFWYWILSLVNKSAVKPTVIHSGDKQSSIVSNPVTRSHTKVPTESPGNQRNFENASAPQFIPGHGMDSKVLNHILQSDSKNGSGVLDYQKFRVLDEDKENLNQYMEEVKADLANRRRSLG